MSKKRAALQHARAGSNKSMRLNSSLSVINDALLSKMSHCSKSASSSSDGPVSVGNQASMWGLLLKGSPLEEMVYRVILHFSMDSRAAPRPRVVMCVMDKEFSQELYILLKSLVKVKYFSEKMTKAQLTVNLRALTEVSVIVSDISAATGILSNEINKFSSGVSCVIHGFPSSNSISLALSKRYLLADHIILASQVQDLILFPQRFPVAVGACVQKIAARMAVAKKIALLTSGEGRVVAADLGATSARLTQLRNRLKVLLVEELRGYSEWDSERKCMKKYSSPCNIEKAVNIGENFGKMLALGMIVSEIVCGAAHKGADCGRMLACSQWMDKRTGIQFGAPWNVVRYGASCDHVSRTVCDIMNVMKAYEIKNSSRVSRPGIRNKPSCGGTMTRRDGSKLTFPIKVAHTLSQCRAIFFSWKPNPFGDDDEWGGCYGKACGHNEIVMFYLRPFAPIEVLNTHVCSKASPAPGNSNFEGCLEFLIKQCAWFRKPMHIWDDGCFHFIDKNGKHFVKSKKDFLSFSLTKIKFLMPQLRWFCVNDPGIGTVDSMMDIIMIYLNIARGVIELRPDLPKNVSSRIGSFLLQGDKEEWEAISDK